MARHNILLIASLLALALFIAHTNCSSEEEHMKERCSKKIQSLNLKPCEELVMKMLVNEEDENVLKMKGINYIRKSRDEYLKENCCAQLSEVKMSDCRCQALQEILDDLNDMLPKMEMGDAKNVVKTLPRYCGIAPPLGCDLNLKN